MSQCSKAARFRSNRREKLCLPHVLDPRACWFILSEYELGPEYQGRSLAPEGVVEDVLAYEPIQLGPAD